MKSKLKLVPHSVLPDEQVVEIWYNGKFIGAIYGADGPGIRVISKHHLHTRVDLDVAVVLIERKDGSDH